MRPDGKEALVELIGGLFAWVWLICIPATVYFIVSAIFFDGSWWVVLGSMIVGSLGKGLSIGFMNLLIQMQQERRLINSL